MRWRERKKGGGAREQGERSKTIERERKMRRKGRREREKIMKEE